MPVVVVGAGYTGNRALSAFDHSIGISRNPPAESGGGQFFTCDLDLDIPRPIALPDSYAMLYTVPPASDGPPDRRLHRLLGSVRPTAKRMVYLSTSGVYGDRRGELTGESTPPLPATDKAKRRLDAERQVLEYCRANAIAAVILRVPGIYGPGRLRSGRAESALPVLLEKDASPGNRIHIDDLLSCCIAALAAETPAGIYNVGDGNFHSSTWFACKIAALAGLPRPPQVALDVARKTFAAERLEFLVESRRLDTSKMRNVLGVVPRFLDPEDGIRASLADEGMLKS